MTVVWVPSLTQLPLEPSRLIKDWLTKPYILSQALKRHCQQLSVKVLSQHFSYPYEDEYALIEVNAPQQAYIRQVFLQGDHVPWTYGRVVVPMNTYQKHLVQFESVGTQFLGEHLLYNNPDVVRGPFEFVSALPTSTLNKDIHKQLGSDQKQTLWGRRSVFKIQSYPLLVTELFLSSIPEFCL